jgi:hypothetical protein
MSPRMLLEPLDRGELYGRGAEGLGLGLGVRVRVRQDSSSFVCEGYVGSRFSKQASRVPALREEVLEEDHRQDHRDHRDRRDQWEVSCSK